MRGGWAVALVAACAPRAQPSWIDHEVPGSTHVTREAAPSGHDAAAPVDVTKLDAAQVDRYDEPTVRAAVDQLGDRAPAARFGLRAARLAHHRGDDREAAARIERARRCADAAVVRGELDALAGALVIPKVDPAKIAVLLPLSGPYAAIGSELRVAIELAPAAGARWQFLDTHGTTDGAVAAVEAAHAQGAIGILGPVGQREAVAAARVAALRGVPIALLAPADGADPSAGVFRAVASAADEGRAVAQLAAQDSYPTVAVFAPRDDLAREAADAFVDEATRLGLQVTGNATYDPTGGDVEPDVKAFLNLSPASNPRLAAHLARHRKDGLTSFSPDVPFTMLYIPDRYDRAAIVAAYLPYYNVELRTTSSPDPDRLARKHGGHIPQIVQLVGGAGWHHPTLPVRGGPAVQGAMIVDDFAGEQGGDAAAQLVEAFQQRAHRPPSTAAAQAHDAAALIAGARAEAAPAAASGGDARAAMRGALAHARIADGACGPASIGPDGEVTRVPAVLEVQGDDLVVVP